MAFLLTWHGTLLCRRRQGGVLVHCPLTDISDDVEPVVLDLPIEQLRADFGHHVRATMPELPSHPPGSLQRFRLQRSADQQTITLGYETAFLSAELEGDRITLVRTEARDWESFLPVSEVDLDALRQILASSWLIRSSGTLIERPTTWRFFNLRVGEHDGRSSPSDAVRSRELASPLDLAPRRLADRADLPVSTSGLLFRVRSTGDHGAVCDQRAFADPVRTLSGADRRIDRPAPAELAKMLPAECMARVTIIPFQPHDRPGFMVARYLILDWPDAWRYQPLLYVDADIVFDRDVTPMLHAIAMSDRIAAPVELMSPLARNPSVGATLLQRDFCSPGYMAGFNSGTLGIPNVRAHAETLRLIRRIIANHSLLHGREALPYADQEIANYVSFRLANFDTGLDIAVRPVWRRRRPSGRALRARAFLAGGVRPPEHRRCEIT